ncbi:rhodanese-related sulfurtransferase, partial [Escherichia coli]|nr:rhodanese-related sulfurtransferase [Escherichia coli]
LDGLSDADFSERGAWSAPLPGQPRADTIDPTPLAAWLGEPGTRVLDFTASANYAKRHIPGAAWVLRSQLKQALERLGTAERYVLTCGSSLL